MEKSHSRLDIFFFSFSKNFREKLRSLKSRKKKKNNFKEFSRATEQSNRLDQDTYDERTEAIVPTKKKLLSALIFVEFKDVKMMSQVQSNNFTIFSIRFGLQKSQKNR